MKYFSVIFLFFISFQSVAQTNNPVAHFTFDQCGQIVEVTGTNSAAFPIGFLDGVGCACGVKDSALVMGGEYVDTNNIMYRDKIVLIGNYNNYFDDDNFTISLYFKATEEFGNRTIYSKLDSCTHQRGLSLRYTAATGFLTAFVGESATKNVELFGKLNDDRCWHHVVLVKKGNRVFLYANGILLDDEPTVSAMDIRNDAEFVLGSGPCVGITDFPFAGHIDELKVFNVALSEGEIEDLYIPNDIIGNRRDTLIVEGTSVDIFLGPTCADEFSWSPTDGVDDPTDPETTITPPESGSYFLSMIHPDANKCVAVDTINITVVNPDSLDCGEIFLPKAFTPNGDNLNEFYGISNPYAIMDFVSFEIFDRWGGRVFYSEDVYAKWDGSVDGKKVNPGVCVFRIVYKCKGEEKIKLGSLTVLR